MNNNQGETLFVNYHCYVFCAVSGVVDYLLSEWSWFDVDVFICTGCKVQGH